MIKGTVKTRQRPYRATDAAFEADCVGQWKEIENDYCSFDCEYDLEKVAEKQSQKQAIINKSV